MQKYRKRFLPLAFVLLAGLSGALLPPAYAQPEHDFCAGQRPLPGAFLPGDVPLPPPFRGLDLNEAQRDEAFRLLHAAAPEMRAYAKNLRRAGEDLCSLAGATQFDETRARALSGEIAKAEAGLALLRARTEHALFALLTPQQRQEAEAASNAGKPGAARRDSRPTP